MKFQVKTQSSYNVIIYATIFAICLTTLPAMSARAAEVCRVSLDGTAVYPPNLPDCLDPVVVAKQEADAKASAEAAAAASASAKAAADLEEQKRIADLIAKDLAAAAAAAAAAAEKAAAEKAAADKAKSDALEA